MDFIARKIDFIPFSYKISGVGIHPVSGRATRYHCPPLGSSPAGSASKIARLTPPL